VETDITTGVLRRLWSGVLVEAERLTEPRTRAAAALMAHGGRAALAGPTGVMIHGCTAMESGKTHIIVPEGRRPRSRAGLVVHHGPLPDSDIVRVDGFRVLCLDRLVADLLSTERPRDGLAITDQALAIVGADRREAFRATVANRLDRRADRRGTRTAARLLALATGCAESPPESWLLWEVVQLGFPPPEANWPIHTPSGVLLYRLDLAWPFARIAVEYDGYAVHHGREVLDARRIDDLERRGWIVIVVTADDLRDCERMHTLLNEAFQRRGLPVRAMGGL
jgi:hypothetical protein